MNKVTFEAYEVAWIRVKGKERPEAKTANLPMTLDDEGLISKMYKFLDQENISPLLIMHSGGGAFNGLFTTIDGEKVEKWLKENCNSGEE
jgi:hypothetical protein